MRVILRNGSIFLLAGFVLLGAQARFAQLDAFTLSLPLPVRSVVATIAVHESDISSDSLDRALALDPDNSAAWSRRCTSYIAVNPQERLADCARAVNLHPSTANLRAHAAALEENGLPCAAQASLQEALVRPDLLGQRSYVMRDQARAALACGDNSGSLVALHSAEEIDQSNESDGLAMDRGYMSAVYDRLHEPVMAKEMCSQANPGYASCTCELSNTGLSCSPQPLGQEDGDAKLNIPRGDRRPQ